MYSFWLEATCKEIIIKLGELFCINWWGQSFKLLFKRSDYRLILLSGWIDLVHHFADKVGTQASFAKFKFNSGTTSKLLISLRLDKDLDGPAVIQIA